MSGLELLPEVLIAAECGGTWCGAGIRRDLIKMPKALRAEINDVVVKYAERKLRKDGSLDVAMMAHEMTQSLVDMIVEQEEHHHAPLFALMILSLGDEYLKRTGNAERRDN